jgi:hypothetical protein
MSPWRRRGRATQRESPRHDDHNTREAWDPQAHDTEQLAVMAYRLAELDGLGASHLDDAAVAARVPQVLADLVEPAKVTALEKLGEGERAIRIATSWLRVKTSALRAMSGERHPRGGWSSDRGWVLNPLSRVVRPAASDVNETAGRPDVTAAGRPGPIQRPRSCAQPLSGQGD